MIRLILLSIIYSSLISQDSIPTWQIIYSKIYHQQFVKENIDYDYELLRKQNELFQAYTMKYFDAALDIIPIYTGIKWPKNYRINIYPTRSKSSFSHPLTIQYHKNQQFMFYMLIHEAVHHNVLIEFKSTEMMEALCDKVAEKVASIIDDDQVQFYETRVYSKYHTLQKMYTWSLDTLSVSEFWELNKKNIENANSVFEKLENAIFHQNLDGIEHYFKELKLTHNQEYIEKAFVEMMAFFSMRSDFNKNIDLGNEYLELIPDGAYKFNILFKLATNYLYAGDEESAQTLLTKLQNSGKEINNFLDDTYLLNGRIESSKNEYSRALKNYLYIIQVLPNGYAKGEAFKNLARIYLRQDKKSIAASLYLEAYRFLEKPNEKGTILVEMFESDYQRINNQYKQAIANVLSLTIRKDLKEKLESIYKRIL